MNFNECLERAIETTGNEFLRVLCDPHSDHPRSVWECAAWRVLVRHVASGETIPNFGWSAPESEIWDELQRMEATEGVKVPTCKRCQGVCS